MAGPGRCQPGGIRGLAGVILDEPKKCAALEFDMIERGMRLRDFPSGTHTWRDLLVIVQCLDNGSAYYRACNEDDWSWDMNNMLSAAAVDALNMLVWMKTEDAQKGRNRPSRIIRPGVTDDSHDVKSFGKGSSMPANVLAEKFGLDLEAMLGL